MTASRTPERPAATKGSIIAVVTTVAVKKDWSLALTIHTLSIETSDRQRRDSEQGEVFQVFLFTGKTLPYNS